jgi:O-antigen/teichoic acid export membrane protein
LIFALGTALTATVLVLDQASLGVMRGELQFIRNIIFAVAKLIALVVLAVWFIAGTGFSIYVTWVIGIAISLVALVGLEIAQGRVHRGYRPRKDALRGMEMHALQHHGLNLVLMGPGLLLPMIVTALLSATTNAYFYTAWMLNGLVSVVPVALATVLYAAGSADPSQRRQKLRFSMGLAFAYSLVAIVVVFVAAPWILGLFGPNYAAQAAVPLTLLVLGVLPTVISEHYVALRRIDRQPGRAAAPLAVGSLVKLILAFVGAKTAGLVGLSIGIVAANFLVALYVTPTMVAALRGREKVTVAATKLG